MNVVLLKLGSAMFVKSEADTRVNTKATERIAAEIASALASQDVRLVIVHGSGLSEEHTGEFSGQIHTLAKAQSHATKLNATLCDALTAAGVPAFPFQYSSGTASRNGRITTMPIGLLHHMLELGIVPVLYGTPSVDEKEGCAYISGDHVACWLANAFGSERVVFADAAGGEPGRELGLAKPSVHNTSPAEQRALNEIALLRKGACTMIDGAVAGNLNKAILGVLDVGTVISANRPSQD